MADLSDGTAGDGRPGKMLRFSNGAMKRFGKLAMTPSKAAGALVRRPRCRAQWSKRQIGAGRPSSS